MKIPRKLRRFALFGMLAIVAVGLAAPFINAARFQQQIHDGLERGLHRNVEIAGKIHFTLFSGPGFVVDDVLIGEDPRIGVEPFAHVSSLSARIRLRSLWTGRLEFSSLRLDEPSVNLVKAADGPWNIQPFLRNAVAPDSTSGKAHLPEIQVRGGRLNVKFGDTKSVYYISNADVDVYALSDAGDSFSIRFEGEPARTDRAAQSFGRCSGRGKWTPAGSRESEIQMSVRWEKSPLAELLTLLMGRDAGVHGLIAAQGEIRGPLSNVQLTGRALLEDVHRWDLNPPKGEGWPVAFRGNLNLPEETLDLQTIPEQDRPVDARLRLRGMLNNPEYGVLVTAKKVPLAPLLLIARHLGAPVAQQLDLAGTLSGAFGYSSSAGLQGAFTATDAAAKTTASDAVRCERADILVDHDLVQLLPAQMAFAHGQGMTLSADYKAGSGALDVQLASRGLAFTEMKAGTGRLLGASAIPVLEQLEGGRWHGALRYQYGDGSPGKWSGNAELESTRLEVPGLSEPVLVRSAKVFITGSQVGVSNLTGQIAKTEFHGDYRYEPEAARPHQLSVKVGELSLAELLRLLKPSLLKQQGFFARTLRMQAQTPDWLKARRAELRLHIDSFSIADTELEDFGTRVLWNGAKIELSDINAQVNQGFLKASLAIDLAKNLPLYAIKASVRKMSWRDGELDGDAQMRATGADADFLSSLRGEGCFSAKSVSLATETEFKTIAGCYALGGGTPLRLKLSKLQGLSNGETYTGTGATQPDGRLVLDFTGPGKPLRLAGTMIPWKLDAVR